MKNRRSVLVAGVLVVSVALLEAVIRISGISDFPIYQADNQIGYIPAPSQSGDFVRKNHWQFNSKSMGGPEFAPSAAVDTLLIGDSVVLGGNPYREEDRLGPQLTTAMKSPVWPISAGSWALRNELKYLKLHPEVVQASDRFVFVSNSGDFDDASSWSCEKTHPRSHPLWASLYVFKKYVWDWGTCGPVPNELLVPAGDWRPELREFLASDLARNKPVVFMFYPDKDEADGTKTLGGLESHSTETLALAAAAHANVVIFSVGRDARWKPTYYRDSVHPSVEGTKVLADIIARPAATTRLDK